MRGAPKIKALILVQNKLCAIAYKNYGNSPKKPSPNYTTLPSKRKIFYFRSVAHIIPPHDTTPSPVKASMQTKL